MKKRGDYQKLPFFFSSYLFLLLTFRDRHTFTYVTGALSTEFYGKLTSIEEKKCIRARDVDIIDTYRETKFLGKHGRQACMRDRFRAQTYFFLWASHACACGPSRGCFFFFCFVSWKFWSFKRCNEDILDRQTGSLGLQRSRVQLQMFD